MPQPFSLDYTQTLLSLLNILSTSYTKLAKLLRWLPFLHTSYGGRFSNWPTERYEGIIYVLKLLFLQPPLSRDTAWA